MYKTTELQKHRKTFYLMRVGTWFKYFNFAFQAMLDMKLRGDVSAWLEKRVGELEQSSNMRNSQDAAFMRTLLRYNMSKNQNHIGGVILLFLLLYLGVLSGERERSGLSCKAELSGGRPVKSLLMLVSLVVL